MKRYFSDKNFPRVKQDFAFLVKIINNSNGEFDLAIRENYFNIYYKGNSLAKVELKGVDYQVSIHSKFYDSSKAHKKNVSKSLKSKDYFNITLAPKELHSFFQVVHLDDFASKIKEVNNGEEITFEQAIITDNLNREDLIIIDRQVTDTALKRKRLDLLALKQVKGSQYQFLILEVKLGNNPELDGRVDTQLNDYITHITTHFADYKKCYETHYFQKKDLGLIRNPVFDKIEIVEPVKGVVVIGGYSGIANTFIPKLKSEVKQFKYEI